MDTRTIAIAAVVMTTVLAGAVWVVVRWVAFGHRQIESHVNANKKTIRYLHARLQHVYGEPEQLISIKATNQAWPYGEKGGKD